MELKKIFEGAEDGKLTFEQLQEAIKKAGANFIDLSEGNYVSKAKHDDELRAKEEQIATLTSTITSRDDDLTQLKEQLETAGTDSKKLKDLTSQFSALQTKYDTDTKEYQTRLGQQAYEFAVREYAGTKKFSSKAAKRDFISAMIAKQLTVEGDKIIGADDFVKIYSEEDPSAFIVEETKPTEPTKPQPKFVSPTSDSGNAPAEDNGGFAFNFIGVRAHDK